MLQVLAILFLATSINSTFGFGLGLIAMPLLSFLVDIKTATPLVALVAGTTSLLIFAKNRREAKLGDAGPMIIASVLGIPFGLYLLKGVADDLMKSILAIMIILFASISLSGGFKFTLNSNRLSPLFGFISGVIASAYNMGGPPIIIYGSLRKWPPSNFRATLQSFFLPVCIFTVASHTIGGLVTSEVLHFFLYSLPIILFTTLVGGKINQFFSIDRFNRYIYCILLLIGVFLLIKTVS